MMLAKFSISSVSYKGVGQKDEHTLKSIHNKKGFIRHKKWN